MQTPTPSSSGTSALCMEILQDQCAVEELQKQSRREDIQDCRLPSALLSPKELLKCVEREQGLLVGSIGSGGTSILHFPRTAR